MAKLYFKNEGSDVGVWASSVTDACATIQANRTSASLMLYACQRWNKELPFVLGVSHSVDNGVSEGFIQIPTMEGKRQARYYTFQQLIAALELVDKVEALSKRLDALGG